jgi:ElaB/YqjD/DUF883 family membrane-anchored ribosome-binding protein
VADAEDRAREATRGVSGEIGGKLEKAKDVAQSGSEWATQMAGTAGDKVRGAVDKAAARTQQAAGGIAENAKGAANHASEWVDQATETVADLRSSAGHTAQRVRVQTDRLGANVSRRAQEHPFTALFVAGAAGYVLSYLLHGRR